MISFNKIIFIWFIYLFSYQVAFSIENKILFKVDGEIITSQDILNQIDYLTSLNKNLIKLEKERIYEISKNSIIKEIIKKKEILKIIKEIKVDGEYLDKIIESTYLKLGFKSINQFKEHLSKQNVKIEIMEKKLTIDALWNELIFKKYSSKIKIDKEKLRKEVNKKKFETTKSYLLSEIVFNVSNASDFDNKYKSIKQSIELSGFENTALSYSNSASSKIGGKLGWINENSINKLVRSIINNISINNYSDPITIPGGFLIIKVNDIKELKKEINVENELKNLVINLTNQQLDQYSNLYFNKIKKNVIINEL